MSVLALTCGVDPIIPRTTTRRTEGRARYKPSSRSLRERFGSPSHQRFSISWFHVCPGGMNAIAGSVLYSMREPRDRCFFT